MRTLSLSKGTESESKDPERMFQPLNADSGEFSPEISPRNTPSRALPSREGSAPLLERSTIPGFLYHLSVLENLDNVDWAKIHHAYGPATDVPAQIRAIAFGDEQQRKNAIWELHGNIWHQHTVYEASSFAVPFLIELVQNKIAEEEVLSLIALLATGTSYLDV